VLRIDDTDADRNVDEALRPILHGFRWLGIDWDEGPEVGGDLGPYYQSQRQDRHEAAVETLLKRNLAYRDYARPEEIQAERDNAQAEKRRFVYSRKWMAETDEQRADFETEGRTAVVRLKMPRSGTCRFKDHIRGDMDMEWELEQDHVIQRADGSCLYNLATVVDDHDMQITHVIRAEEHLSNTPRQIFIARGLGFRIPEFAHLPFVAEPGSKHKLSKRKLDKYLKHPDFAKLNEHGRAIAAAIGLETSGETFNPVVVEFYEQVGYLPDALVNYMLLLGWSLDDKTEFFTRQEMIGSFSLERVNKAAASFDPAKLSAFQERYMAALSPEEKVERTLPYLEKAGLLSPAEVHDGTRRVREIVQAAGDRIKVAGDILDYSDFFTVDDELAYDDRAFEKRLRKPEEAAVLLHKFRDELQGAESFDTTALESLMQDFVESEGVKIGQVIHALRVAVTGKAVGFGMFETLAILGRERCLARIDRALARL
jgi:glutamyl-tRNA synthetase